MGYEVGRFNGDVDEELLCPICAAVLEGPVQAPHCEHAFCNACIREWLLHQEICPVDRSPLTTQELTPAPRILRNLLARLKISCENTCFGCNEVVKLDVLEAHQEQCAHNPKRPTPCKSGCGLIIPLDEMPSHNCVKELRQLLDSRVGQLEAQLNELRRERERDIAREVQVLVQRELQQMLEVRMGALTVSPAVSIGRTEDEARAAQIQRWSSALRPARVTRWGGMISTPDAVLQAVIKRALLDSGCPHFLVNELMENAHERRWPRGLSTLETRQMNRRRYEQFEAKRIPGKQAVVVLQIENMHMGDSLTVDPGLVMIFAHGIE